ncbi:MAG: glycosyltransferase family 2 protein [Candidatus Marsarchaeota archaeon]|nr:glycosyltransferase family 2 protein [Candidatus Marsarchaeota archaeon]
MAAKSLGFDLMVSVIIPTYNRAKYVAIAIESALNQDYPSLEVIVVDDGSTDGTREALRPYAGRIRYIYQENQGESVARNTGVQLARSAYIAFLDDDDVWLEHKLARQVEYMESNQTVGLVACQGCVIDETGVRQPGLAFHRTETGEVSSEEIILDSSIGPSASLLKRAAFDDVGGFDSRIHYGEDWDLALRIAARHKVAYLAESLVLMRNHAGRQSDFWLNLAKARRRHADHLIVLQQIGGSCSNTSLWTAHDHALAQEHTELAICLTANGRYEEAEEYLAHAVALSPTLPREREHIDDQAVACAHALERAQGLPAAVCFLEALSGLLAAARKSTAQPGHVGGEYLGKFYADMAFQSAASREWPSVRRFALKSASLAPRHHRNRGLISLVIGSLLGYPGLAALCRAVSRQHQESALTSRHLL